MLIFNALSELTALLDAMAAAAFVGKHVAYVGGVTHNPYWRR
jgi:hypothetical protein